MAERNLMWMKEKYVSQWLNRKTSQDNGINGCNTTSESSV